MRIIAIIIVLLISIAVLQSLFSSPVFWVLVCVFAFAIGALLLKDKIKKKGDVNPAPNFKNYVQEEKKDEYELNLDLLARDQMNPKNPERNVEAENYVQTDSFYTKVAGVSFGNTQSLLPNLKRGMKLDFFREPTNPYDNNAIRIECQGKAIGHLSRYVAEQLAPKIDSGNIYITGKIKEITGGGTNEYYGCNIEVFVWENQSEKNPLSVPTKR